MTTLTSDQGTRDPSGAGRLARICLPTARRFNRMAFQCAQLEAQDVLVDCDDVDLICLEPEPSFPHRLQWLRRLMYRDVSRRLAYVNPGLRGVKLTADYDLLVVMCQGYWDFLYVNAIDGWKDHCKTSVCWIDELWAADLPYYKYWIPSLRRFDHVIVGMHGTARPLAEMIDRPCHWVPGGVDTLRFTPYPDAPQRVIDIYSVGRRLEAVHAVLRELTTRKNVFYLYDTLHTGESHAADHRQHRELYANTAKRSRFFMVAPGKVNVPEETQGQIEVGLRYYEGSAAGAVLLGQAPDCQSFREMFNWPESVIPVRADGSDVVDVLSDLVGADQRRRAIGERNAQEALRRHDWAYRWRRILEIAGLRPAARLESREETLKGLATSAGTGQA